MDEEEVHIAVGKNTRKEKAKILWAAANFPRATIVLVHVHWPSKWMPFNLGGKVLYKFANEKEKEIHRGRETEAMVKMLSQYKSFCGARKVSAHYLTHDDTVAGVVNLIKKLKIKRIVIGSSNDHLKHTGSIGYGGSSDILASIHELGDESDGYTTPPSDFVDEITNEEEVIEMDDSDQLVTEAETLTEERTEESTTYEEVEIFAEEGADRSDEIQSFRNITEKAEKIMAKIDKLQKKLKELQGEGHNHEESSLLPRQMAASLKKKTLSQPRHPDLQIPEHIAQFSMPQILKATDNFHSRNLIGEGGYGLVYKGKLGGMPMAIKLLRPHGRQGFLEYQQEVVVLSRLEHPHIVRLIGVCPESCSLVYEHLPNGTLLDRLSKGLLWKDRVRILAEQRSALAYLHSSRPHAIIHADLKMTNILLDAGNVSRLGDFGTARVVHVKPLEEETIRRRTNPMGTTGYMDPVFFITGELTTESDVYAFGVVILRLLTGLLDLNIAEQVREAVKMDAVHSVLDASAGAWPEVQAERLLKLALRCCSLERKRRPAITCDAEWRPLDILRAMNTPANKSRKWNSLAS
ncbi:U-box domain-containing protein 33-like isoform X3 [Phragmites australis]|uniref:U-box domain-containing protein 33-like isoform X3 n=1 Tax=Phragmites australis TaxID=29695 RepID=UPI002D77A3AE|nr:U-box domain-containing protein 33-like isoform X3 [Phragmites australis]